MEQQEEKGKDSKRRRQIKSTSLLPIDLTSEILFRLPEKSVGRFRCVSKLWLSITTDPYFINSFETRNPRPSTLLCLKKGGNLFVTSIPQPTHTSKSFSSSQPIDSYRMKYPGEKNSKLAPTESVHGLICFQEKENLIVWNPSKKEFLTLPKPMEESWKLLKVFLGYDPVEGKHKVMCMPRRRSSDVCRVLTLGSIEESWRSVKTNYKHHSEKETRGQCIKGVIYYVAYMHHTKDWVLMCFDVRSEKFDRINLPSDIYREMPFTYHGKLAYVEKTSSGTKGGLWILEDSEKHKWSSQAFGLTFDYYNEHVKTSFSLKGFTDAGEFVFAPSKFRKSSYVFFFPLKFNFRTFEFKEITDGELTNAVVHVFPNHIANQTSL